MVLHGFPGEMKRPTGALLILGLDKDIKEQEAAVGRTRSLAELLGGWEGYRLGTVGRQTGEDGRRRCGSSCCRARISPRRCARLRPD